MSRLWRSDLPCVVKASRTWHLLGSGRESQIKTAETTAERNCSLVRIKPAVRGPSCMRHIFRFYESVEFFACEEAQLDGGVAQTDVLMMRRVCHFGGVVVADLRR